MTIEEWQKRIEALRAAKAAERKILLEQARGPDSAVPLSSEWITWPMENDPTQSPVEAPKEVREFDGFCDPCGGLRKHKIGCPIKRGCP